MHSIHLPREEGCDTVGFGPVYKRRCHGCPGSKCSPMKPWSTQNLVTSHGPQISCLLAKASPFSFQDEWVGHGFLVHLQRAFGGRWSACPNILHDVAFSSGFLRRCERTDDCGPLSLVIFFKDSYFLGWPKCLCLSLVLSKYFPSLVASEWKSSPMAPWALRPRPSPFLTNRPKVKRYMV